MYSIKACKSVGPTENAPYPLCHANFDNAGDCVLSHLDEEDFNIFHQLRNSRCARQSNRQVNMVGNAPHAITFAFGIANDSGKISVERRTHGSIELRHSVLRAEDYMDEQKRERLWHRSDYRSGLQPSFRSAISFLGLRPRLVYPAPSALIQSNLFSERPPCSTLS